MKKIIFHCLVFMILIPGKCFAGNNLLSAAEFNKILRSQKNVLLIDIRTPEEFQTGYIKKAVNIDWYNNFEDYIQDLDTSKTILFYCGSGGRSADAAKLFAYKGFKNAYELKGGLSAWKKTKHSIVIQKSPVNAGISLVQFRAIIQSNQLVLIDFNAPWCKPCKLLSPILDSIANENKTSLVIQKIDIDQNIPLAKQMKVISLPLLILYEKGTEVWRKNEFISKDNLSAVIKFYQN